MLQDDSLYYRVLSWPTAGVPVVHCSIVGTMNNVRIIHEIVLRVPYATTASSLPFWHTTLLKSGAGLLQKKEDGRGNAIEKCGIKIVS